MNYQDKVKNKFYKVINKEFEKVNKLENREEILYKAGVLYKFFQVFSYYEELEPTIKNWFDEKADRDRFKGEDR